MAENEAETAENWGLVMEVLRAIAFVIGGGLVYNWLCMVQERVGVPGRKSTPKWFYRGSVRGKQGNAEWFVDELLERDEGLKGGANRRERIPQTERAPDWERLYPTRVMTHDHDASGTTAKLSTADMINMRWNLPLCVCLELGLFADLVVKDFIMSWYNVGISKDPQFPDDVRSVLQNVIGKLGDRVLNVNLPMFLLRDMTYVLRHHLRWFNELDKRARKRCHPPEEYDQMEQEDRKRLIQEEFRRAGHLHPACSLTGQVDDPKTKNYIRGIVSELLVRVLPEEDYHCAALRHLVREVLTCNILVPALNAIGPDVINAAILTALQTASGVSGGASEEHPSSDDEAENDSPGTRVQNAEKETESKSKDDEAFGKVTSDKAVASEAGNEEDNTQSTEIKVDPEIEKTVQAEVESIDTNAQESHEAPPLQESISFIHEADSEIQKEEANRLVVELHTALGDCVETFTEDPEQTLGDECAGSRNLILALDALLRHGLIPHAQNDMYGSLLVEPWWDFARHLGELMPSSEMSTGAVDSVVEAFCAYYETREKETKNVRDDDATKVSKVVSRPASPNLISRSFLLFHSSKNLIEPGKVWLAMMLKHKLLADAMNKLLEDKSWTSSFYSDEAAIRSPKILPMLAALNGIEFDFNLEDFWERAAKVKESLERKGVHISAQDSLRRMRRRLANTLTLNIHVPRIGGRGLKAVAKRERAIVALQERVGPIHATVANFTIKHDRSKVRNITFVQYLVHCSLTRLEDGGTSSWTVFRRYNQFHDLHTELKSLYSSKFNEISLPKKTNFSVFGSQSVAFITKRKAELDTYLQKILSHPVVCDSDTVLKFLSPQTEEELNLPDNAAIVPAVTTDEDLQALIATAEGAGMDSPSKPSTSMKGPVDVTKRISGTAEDQPEPGTGPRPGPGTGTGTGTGHGNGTEAGPRSKTGTTKAFSPAASGPRGATHVSAKPKDVVIDPYDVRTAEGHIFKLAEEVFGLKELGMVKRNLIAVTKNVVSLLFQGTAHKWLRENYTRQASAEILADILSRVRELLWPDGKFVVRSNVVEPTPEELRQVEKNRVESLEEMKKAIPSPLIKFLGRKGSNASMKRMHDFFQHPILIHNLVFTTMDLLLLRIFQDLPLKELHARKPGQGIAHSRADPKQ